MMARLRALGAEEASRRIVQGAGGGPVQRQRRRLSWRGPSTGGNSKKVLRAGAELLQLPRGGRGLSRWGRCRRRSTAFPTAVPLYLLGILLLFGALLGRAVCAFLCPFGLIQELLYKIPTKKAQKEALGRGA